jgi:hypothetical protein
MLTWVERAHLSTSHSSVRTRTHGCVLVRTAREASVRTRTHDCVLVRTSHETLSQHTPAMKEWVEEIVSSSIFSRFVSWKERRTMFPK